MYFLQVQGERNFPELAQSATLLKKGYDMGVPVNFGTFLRTPFLQYTFGRILLAFPSIEKFKLFSHAKM